MNKYVNCLGSIPKESSIWIGDWKKAKGEGARAGGWAGERGSDRSAAVSDDSNTLVVVLGPLS